VKVGFLVGGLSVSGLTSRFLMCGFEVYEI
jgi:hypothetical protein